MSRAIASISRRKALVTTAAGTVAAVALRSTIAHADPIHDPILDLIAEADRLHTLAKAASARAAACAKSVNDDCAGCGCWIPFDADHPALKHMHSWLLVTNAERRGSFFSDVLRVSRDDIEAFNRHTEQLGGPERKAQGEARLAWYDGRMAERERNAELSGYSAACDESEEIWERFGDAQYEAAQATATTIAGAMAQLAFAIDIKRQDNTIDGELSFNFDDEALMNAYATLARLLPSERAA